jgi:hypothetical protein
VTADDSNRWRVDSFAALLRSGEARKALEQGEAMKAVRRAVVVVRRDRDREKDRLEDALNAAEVKRRLRKAVDVLGDLMDESIFDRVRSADENCRAEDFPSAAELIASIEYQQETKRIVFAAYDRLLEVTRTIADDRDVRGPGDPARYAAAQRMYYFVREAVAHRAGVEDAVLWEMIEAAWLDADLGKIGAEASGPEFRRSLRKHLM